MPLVWFHLKSTDNKIKLQTHLDRVSTDIPQGLIDTGRCSMDVQRSSDRKLLQISGVSVSDLFDSRSNPRLRSESQRGVGYQRENSPPLRSQSETLRTTFRWT